MVHFSFRASISFGSVLLLKQKMVAFFALLVLLPFASANRMLFAAAPAPAPISVDDANGLASLVTSTDDPATKDCHNYRAVLQNIDVRFLGPERTAAVGAVSVAYRRFGPLAPLTGLQRPLVLVIGIACTMSDWTPRLLRALAANREVIIFDNAGIGFSSIAPNSAPAAAVYFRFQADTVAGLISTIGLTQPDILGWSLGAKVALHVAVYHGSAVRKVISAAGSAGGAQSSTAVIDAVNGDLSVRLGRAGALLERPDNIRAVCQWLIEKAVMPNDDVTVAEIRAQVIAEVDYHKGNGIVPLLPGVTNPTLVVTGSEDITNPPVNQGPVVAGIRGSVLVTFPGCGHLALFQEVDKFVGLVNNFTAAAGAFTPQPDSYYTCSSAVALEAEDRT